MSYFKPFAITTSFIFFTYSGIALAEDDMHNSHHVVPQGISQVELSVDLGWESKYVSEGRDNLDSGGIYWSGIAAQYQDVNAYARVGRADNEHYTEWQFGLEYCITLSDNFDAAIGYQRLEFYGDEGASDNELFSSITYSGIEWLTPSINYTYSTEAGGYFIELSLHSSWDLSKAWNVTPYLTQGIDYQYVTETHNGRNNLQFGVESAYALTPTLNISGHVSQSIAQQDIEQEVGYSSSKLNETFAGVSINWLF
ncbi:hypothetical protein [Shewanella psychromarinicola]|uniref:Uncharacterized protein n=1 Tax=Shewanella psychromarinicola TaxID=2487742 RepID=A0A3N4EJ70_9GAMM|nr:hypothetical protein [Shewanella psychromarinicola]AZG36445.1 hypothetical protein EGC80_17345 [Shewanella psychromarinicola]MCL1084429.1 hypothetical protein [Shewanella psychromarinicola]RPA34290.1 hypothetical protein EGC77_00965 [Shewanella psychromarinicola]